MSIDTNRLESRAGPDRPARWAGRILVLFGTGHLLGAFALTFADHADRWFAAELWKLDEGIVDMSPAMAAFWLTTGSFGAPLVVVGALVLWLVRRGVAPPAFLGWALGAWSLTAAAIVEPAPWVLICAAAGLLVTSSRRSAARGGHTAPGRA